jgi:hypothetical protein
VKNEVMLLVVLLFLLGIVILTWPRQADVGSWCRFFSIYCRGK